MTLRKLSSGEQVKIAHQDYNRWQDAGLANALARLNQGEGLVLPDSQEGIILIQNTLDRALPRYAVLGVLGTVYDPRYSTQQSIDFQNQIALKGELPSSTTTGRFCVLQTDAAPGEVVPAMVSGVTPVRLSVTAITDAYADIETNAALDQTKWLKTGGSGAAQILYQPEVVGDQWGVVRLSNRPSGAQIKLIRYSDLPAAYDGTSAVGITGAAATSNGNVNTGVRQIFPKLWQNAYDINSSGELEANTETGYCVNLGYLPIDTGWAIATKLPSTHPDFGDVWAIMPDAASHFAPAHYTWITEESAGDWTIADGSPILVRCASGTSTGTARTTNWTFPWASDIMLSHTGIYSVTFGYRGRVSLTDPPYFDITTSAQSAGTAHTHTYQLPAGFHVEFGIHRNFQPGTSVVGTNPNSTHSMTNYHVADTYGTGFAKSNTHEKTIEVEYDATPWHGQHHTRLTPYMKVSLESGASSAGTPKFTLMNAWLSVRPARYRGGSGAVDGYFTGANQYPGGYSGGLGTFVWYGGGTEPDYIDKAGAAY